MLNLKLDYNITIAGFIYYNCTTNKQCLSAQAYGSGDTLPFPFLATQN